MALLWFDSIFKAAIRRATDLSDEGLANSDTVRALAHREIERSQIAREQQEILERVDRIRAQAGVRR